MSWNWKLVFAVMALTIINFFGAWVILQGVNHTDLAGINMICLGLIIIGYSTVFLYELAKSIGEESISKDKDKNELLDLVTILAKDNLVKTQKLHQIKDVKISADDLTNPKMKLLADKAELYRTEYEAIKLELDSMREAIKRIDCPTCKAALAKEL